MISEHRWQGPHYRRPHPERATILAFVLAFIGLLFGFWQKDWLAAGVMLLFGALVFIHARREPPMAEFHVGPHGVSINDTHYHPGQIRSFWIQYEPLYNIKELSLHLKSHWHPYIIVPLEDQNPTIIRRVMLPHITEEHHPETMGTVVMRVLGL